MSNIPLPDELTEFIPEEFFGTGIPTWRLVIDPENDTAEIQNNVWSRMLIGTLIGMVVFMAVIVGIAYYFLAQLSDLPINPLFLYIAVPFCGYSGVAIFIAIMIYSVKRNAATWKDPCRFRYDRNLRELFFSREEKRYGRHDYRTVVIGITGGYNLRDVPQFDHLAPEDVRKRNQSRLRDANPTYASQFYFLVERNDGTWARHLVAYDENAKGIRRAAKKLADMLECRLVMRSMTYKECSATQLFGRR